MITAIFNFIAFLAALIVYKVFERDVIRLQNKTTKWWFRFKKAYIKKKK